MAWRLNHAERQLQLLELCRINGNQPVPVFLLALTGHIGAGHMPEMKGCPAPTTLRIRSIAGGCGTLWLKSRNPGVGLFVAFLDVTQE